MLVCDYLLLVVMDGHGYYATNGGETNWLGCKRVDIYVGNDRKGATICPRSCREEVERNDKSVDILSCEASSKELLDHIVHSEKKTYKL